MGRFVTSDLHLNHHNILSLEAFSLQRNGYGYIKTIDQYNDMIINNINLVVGAHDTLYILGDVGFGSCANLKILLDRINCRNLILLFGNHDRYNEAQACGMGFTKSIREPYYLPESKGKIILSHFPIFEAKDNPYIAYNMHGHLHGSRLDLPNFINVNIAMNHYIPINLDMYINSSTGKGRKRQEPWLHEWYKYNQIFLDKTRGDIPLDEYGKMMHIESN